MSEAKKIGASKYKNKQKYKNKEKVIPKVKEPKDDPEDVGEKIVIDDDYPYRRRGLQSNWHRYEAKDETEEVIDVGKDFSAIVSAPISQGNYFQFKSDKNLDNYNDEQIESEIFKIDMKLLSLSLSSIPFHIRCNIDEKYFCMDVLSVNNANATKAKECYENALKELEEKKMGSTSEDSKTEAVKTPVNKGQPIEGNLASVSLKKNNIGTNKAVGAAPVSNEKEDLEKWLDDILDD